MTTKEVAQMVASINAPNNLPYAYYEFPDNTELEPPFLCFMYTDSNDMMADNQNYTDQRTLVIELYTKQKDLALESAVRSVLISNNLPFRMSSEFLSSEQLYITLFTTEVIIDG